MLLPPEPDTLIDAYEVVARISERGSGGKRGAAKGTAHGSSAPAAEQGTPVGLHRDAGVDVQEVGAPRAGPLGDTRVGVGGDAVGGAAAGGEERTGGEGATRR